MAARQPLPLRPVEVDGVARQATGRAFTRDGRVALQQSANLFALMVGTLADDHRAACRRGALTREDIDVALADAGFQHLLPELHARLRQHEQ